MRSGRRRSARWLFGATAGLAALATILIATRSRDGPAYVREAPAQAQAARPEPPASRGAADPAREARPLRRLDDPGAVVVPTADTTLPAGRNALWVATLEMAWHELGRVAFDGPPRSPTGAEIVDRMNRAPRVSVPPGSTFVRAARHTRAEMNRARGDLFRAFPGAIEPPFGPPGPGYFSLAYLETGLTFARSFRVLDKGLAFRGTGSPAVRVEAFGIGEDDGGRLLDLRKQVAVLYDERDAPPPRLTETGDLRAAALDRQLMSEALDAAPSGPFVLDLDRGSATNQVILARVDRKRSLAATWDHVAHLIARPVRRKRAGLGRHDTLAVPRMAWELERRFPELEGQALTGRNGRRQSIDKAIQITKFRLDRKGVELASLALLTTRGAHRSRAYPFHEPFLVALRTRGGDLPYFLLWVEDPGLLIREN